MLRLLMALFLTILTVGCGPRYVDYFPYHDDGTMKPHVVLLPIHDSSGANLPWGLPEEFDQGIRYQVMNNGDLFLYLPCEIQEDIARCGSADQFGLDLSYATCFRNTDFVVAADIIEYRLTSCEETVTPCSKTHPQSKMLKMRVRIRIIDIRNEKPCIVLQEIVCGSYPIPPERGPNESLCICFGGKGYASSALGLAHQRMIRDLVQRVESITWNVR